MSKNNFFTKWCNNKNISNEYKIVQMNTKIVQMNTK